jgi:hypothetical protein
MRGEPSGTGPSCRRLVGLFGRGLATGIASVTLTTAVLSLVVSAYEPCGGAETRCYAALGQVGLMIIAAPVLLAVLGPLTARLLRFPWPGCLAFAAPAGWLGVWFCVGLPGNHGLLSHPGANLAILLILYGPTAWLAGRRTARRRAAGDAAA